MTSLIERDYGVVTLFGQRVCGFRQENGWLKSVRLDDSNEIAAEAAVLAAGPEAPFFKRDLPETRSIRPVRGYSLTIPVAPDTPRVSLTDVKRKLAFAAIGNRLRVAGLADIERPGAGFDADRFEVLRSTAASVLTDFRDPGPEDVCWSGERPMTPSSQPIIGPSRHIRGLYLNIGHGMLGWTLALGSARRIADLIAGH